MPVYGVKKMASTSSASPFAVLHRKLPKETVIREHLDKIVARTVEQTLSNRNRHIGMQVNTMYFSCISKCRRASLH